MPNRREPLTNEKVHYIQSKGKQFKKQGMMDNIHLAMSNWLILGMEVGFRISEWAQTNSPPTIADNFKRNVDGTSTAFSTDDLILFSKGKKKINTIKSLAQRKRTPS